MTIEYAELARDASPTVAGFNRESGKVTSRLYVSGDEDISDVILDLLGSVSVKSSESRLTRKLPKAHPMYPWLFAGAINNIVGVGFTGEVDPFFSLGTVYDYAPTSYAGYDRYELTVEYIQPWYPLLPDEDIKTLTTTWYNEIGVSTSLTYSREWERFVDIEIQPVPEMITATQGNMVFRLSDATPTSPGAPPHRIPFPGMPSMLWPKSVINLTWYNVPYSYVSSVNSYLTKYIGYVNQFQFLFRYDPGTLLYTGFTARRYTPPVPKYDSIDDKYIIEKVCDITMKFEYTSRSVESTTATISNPNWIAGGHNCLPWMKNRKYYYATTAEIGTDGNPAKWIPLYLSVPFEILFQNPDVSE